MLTFYLKFIHRQISIKEKSFENIMLKKSQLGSKPQNIFRVKELSFGNKPGFSNPNIFAIQCRRPLIFQTMNSVRSYNDSLKY